MNQLIPLVLSLIAVVIASLSLYKAEKMPEFVEEEANKVLSTLDETLSETLKPIQTAISTSYSHMGTKGANAKQVKAMDKRIAQDMLNMQDPLIQGALDMFPNVKEYVTKNPNMLMELLPRIQQLQSIEGFKLPDLLGAPPSSPSNPTSHPFGKREE